jgi:hypothetical protein
VVSSSRVSNTVYVREPLSEGSTILSQPDCGVVVFGDVPEGASIAAGADVIVMGRYASGALSMSSYPNIPFETLQLLHPHISDPGSSLSHSPP